MVCAEKKSSGILRVIAAIAAEKNFTARFAREQFKHPRATMTT
jgi:hypothetical protein